MDYAARIAAAAAIGWASIGAAHAASRIVLPEPGSLGLLILGVAGVVIGRHASRKPPPEG